MTVTNAKTPAERQQALRDARKASGLVSVRFWVKKELVTALKALVAASKLQKK